MLGVLLSEPQLEVFGYTSTRFSERNRAKC
jgi:hypothetical protein